MAEPRVTRNCSEHSDKTACAVCAAHKTYVCLTCVLKKCKTCNAVELDTDAGQVISDILQALSEVTDALETLKSEDAAKRKTLQEIELYYQELLTRMKKSKDALIEDCTNKLPTQGQKLGSEQEKLKAFKEQLEAMLAKLRVKSSENIGNMQNSLTRIQRAMAPLCDKEATQMKFVRCPDYELLLKKDFGTVVVTDLDLERGSDVFSEVCPNNDDTVYDDAYVGPEEAPRNEDDDDAYNDVYLSLQKASICGDIDDYASTYFRRGKPSSKSNTTERPSSGGIIGKLEIKFDKANHHSTPCIFSKVDIDNNRLLLLDSEHRSVLVVNNKGILIEERPWPFSSKFMAFMSDKNIAVLQEKPLTIVKFEYNGHNITNIKINRIDRNMQGVVGFDYDRSTRTFAIISQTDILLVNIDENTLHTEEISLQTIITKVGTTVEVNHDLVHAVFMFPKRIVAFMHMAKKTIKLFDPRTETCTRKLLDTSIASLAISTDGGGIFIFSSSNGMQFSLDGEVVKRFDIPESQANALSMCLGLWDSRKVIVLTSQSDDRTASRQITLIAK